MTKRLTAAVAAIMATAAVVFGALALAPAPALAADSDQAKATISVTQMIVTAYPQDVASKDITYALVADTADAPMPAEASEPVYRFKLTGADDAKNIIIDYGNTVTGKTYKYTLYCLSEDEGDFRFPDQTFEITAVTYTVDGYPAVTAVIKDNSSGLKVGYAEYETEYLGKHDEPPADVDDNNRTNGNGDGGGIGQMGDMVLKTILAIGGITALVLLILAIIRKRRNER